jgi:hypothetical protein
MIWSSFRKLLSNPMSIFVYGILSKWYIMIAMAGMVVTFWVFKGLESSGVLSHAYHVVDQALQETKSVARYCTPKIANIGDFWNCLSNPPAYEATPEEKSFEAELNKGREKLIKSIQDSTPNDPYDNE